jgi:hypothetical protein
MLGVIELAVGADHSFTQKDKIGLLHTLIVKKWLSDLSDNFRDLQTQSFL